MLSESTYVDLYCDRRLGGMEHWIYGPVPERMRIPDHLLDCVVFLGTRQTRHSAAHFEIRGTAFFVSKSSEIPGRSFIYLVTARHCVEKATDTGDDLWVRLNTKDGKSEWVEIDVPWHMPDDAGIDVAVLPFVPPTTFSYQVLSEGMFVNEENRSINDIGVGDDLYVTGLFTMRSGHNRNLPIVRAGILAAMPDEPFIDQENGFPYDAYLAEMRSLGGLSGSPVFVALGPVRPHGGEMHFYVERIEYHLLGLIRGHWDVKKIDATDYAEDELRDVNMGIALVTPIYHVTDILNGEILTKVRREHERKIQRENAPTKDAALPDEDSEFNRFEKLTRDLVKVPKKELDRKRKDKP